MIRSILKSLLKPDAYPEAVTGVELIQTHVSYIFLTDQHAYKIKKPVDFGFLNFSTIDRRRFYCNEEVRLNRRLCPDIYEGVVELREAPNGAAFHGTGSIIDYAVRMKRLPAGQMLDRLVAGGEIDASTMRKVSRVIAEFHLRAPTTAAIADHGQLERIMFNWQENFDQMQPFEDSTLPVKDREVIRAWVSRFAEEHEEVFQKRVDDGFIRECDGDIHLENICLDHGAVHIFDCIEFNDRFRCCDTAADIAFLLMDLDFHGRRDLANEAMDEYVSVTGDDGAVRLLDFYKIYRAFVRGKVESFRLNDSGISQEEQELARCRAIRYFRLVRGYIERTYLMPSLFITCGLMGAGKSVLTSQLAFELGVNAYNSDIIRKQLAGVPVEKTSRDAFNEGLYSQSGHEVTYNELLNIAGQHLSAGRSVIIDASFGQRARRTAFARLARHHGVQFVILYVICSETEVRRRLYERETSGASVSDGRMELLADQSGAFETPDDTEGILFTLHSTDPPSALTDVIYSRLASC